MSVKALPKESAVPRICHKTARPSGFLIGERLQRDDVDSVAETFGRAGGYLPRNKPTVSRDGKLARLKRPAAF
jgi:hypothetical protein